MWDFIQRVGRGFLTPPILWRPPILPTTLPPFSNFVQSPHLILHSPPLLFLLPCLFGLMGDHTTFCVVLLNDIMDLHMLSLGNFVPEEPCCIFYATRHQVY